MPVRAAPWLVEASSPTYRRAAHSNASKWAPWGSPLPLGEPPQTSCPVNLLNVYFLLFVRGFEDRALQSSPVFFVLFCFVFPFKWERIHSLLESPSFSAQVLLYRITPLTGMYLLHYCCCFLFGKNRFLKSGYLYATWNFFCFLTMLDP